MKLNFNFKNQSISVVLITFFALSFSINGCAQWTEKNNGLKGGQVRSLAAAGDTIFVGTLNGLFRSVNGGAVWEKLIPDATVSIFSIRAIAFSGPNIFCSSGGYFSSKESFYVSSDYGKNWTDVSAKINNSVVRCIKISGNNIFLGTDAGIYRSVNNGISWSAINAGLTSLAISSIAIDNNIIFAAASGKVFKSTNGGASWIPLELGTSYVNKLTIKYSTLYAATSDGILRSVDEGVSWKPINQGLSSNAIKDIVVSGVNLFALSWDSIFSSSDNGDNWIVATSNLNDASLKDGFLNCIITNGDKILVGNEFGEVYAKKSNLTDWIRLASGFTNVSVKAIEQINNNIFLATEGDGIFLSQNNGENWTRVKKTLRDFNSLAAKGNIILAASPYDGVLRSQDNGQTWQSSNSESTSFLFTSQLTISGNKAFVSTGGGLFVSDDYGLNWRGTKIANNGVPLTSGQIISFKVHATRLFAGTISDGIFFTEDNGLNWSLLYAPIVPSTVKSMAFNGDNYFAGINRKFYRSTDSGLNWNSDTNLPSDIVIESLAIFESDVFAAAYGVYSSIDNGKNWAQYGLSTQRINIVATIGNQLFAGTQNNGLFVRELFTITGDIYPKNNIPKPTIYPNPANDWIHVSFDSKLQEKIVSIYSLTGIELISKSLSHGEDNIYLGELGIGIYIMRIETLEQVSFIRIVKM
jgi:photosystem II stability/assembly factor-like uncharacterized protein